ncbi:MAG: hypothetical protein LC104_22290 [Bacteroidales bacterium]|nr:hypothetical protein [Bacteroidales bacterium]
MPKAASLESPPQAQINALRSLLQDRYSRTAILKEWLQNADDAGATAVLVATVQTPPGCQHELLKPGSPAIVVLNDGKFDAGDSQAIRQFGLNNKSGDGAAIGKFGLGLKSVFHLCEAFFFLSPTPTTNDADGEFSNLVNPWSGTKCHPSWNDVESADLDRLKKHLEPACRRLGERWFALWLPLRRSDYLDSGRIQNEPYDRPPENLLNPPDIVHFGPAAALLKQLNRVELWDHMPATGEAPSHHWELRTPERGSGRSHYPIWVEADPPPASTQSTMTGQCDVAGQIADYALAETWWNAEWARAARTQPEWPNQYDLQGIEQPDKARPHAAIILTRWHGREGGQFHDTQAVFLPLSAGASHPPPQEVEFLLLYHGCFFVDSGRGKAYTGDGVRGEWNRNLMQDGVLPLVVPAVRQLARTCDPAAIRRLTNAVQRWMEKNGHDRRAICRDGGWAYRWRPRGFCWEVIQTNVQILEIPSTSESGAPKHVLPALADLARDDSYALIPADAPRLLAQEPKPWPDELLARVLDVHDVKPLLEGGFAYFTQFVRQQTLGCQAQNALTKTIRRIFSVAGKKEFAQISDGLNRLIAMIPASTRRSIKLGGNWPDETRQKVCGATKTVLIVPDEFNLDTTGTGTIPTNDAISILRLLREKMTPGRNTNPAIEVIAAAQEPAAVCDATADLKLWKGQWANADKKSGEYELWSLSGLRNHPGLFCGPLNDDLRDLAAAVQPPIAVLDSDTAKILFSQKPLRCGDSAGILDYLTTVFPDLQKPAAARLPLLQRLMAVTEDESTLTRRRRAVRYLLHGNRNLPAGNHLYLLTDGEAVWERLARFGLTERREADHLLPENDLIRHLNPSQREELGLLPLNPDGVASILGGVSDSSLASLNFSNDEERDRVLKALGNHQELIRELIRRLPLHDREGGGRDCLTDTCYWRDRDNVDLGTLAVVVTIVIPHTDEVLAVIQKKARPQTLNYRMVVKLAIQHGPAQHWKTVLDALNPAGFLDADSKNKLTEEPWLPTQRGKPVSPKHVLYDEKFNDEIEKALKGCQSSASHFIPFTALDTTIQERNDLTALKRLFPDRKPMLSQLGGLLGQNPQFHVGKIDDWPRWCQVFRKAPAKIMAAAPLIAKVYDHAPEECQSHLLPNLGARPAADRLVQILAYLREQHPQSGGQDRQDVEHVHNSYLKQFASHPGEAWAKLPQLRLLNQNGNWVEATKLCIAAGIDPADTLDHSQAKILNEIAKKQEPKECPTHPKESSTVKDVEGTMADAVTRSAAKLQTYFEPWRTADAQLAQWVGAFVALLGSDDLFNEFVLKCLGDQKISREFIRSLAGMSVGAARLKRQRFLVEVTEVKENMQIVSLTGQKFPARTQSQFKHLLLGYKVKLFSTPYDGLDIHHIHLRVVDTRHATDSERLKELRELLEETAKSILWEVYGDRNASPEPVFTELARGSLADIRIAQAEILEAAGHYLRTLGSIVGLKEILRRFQDASRRRAEENEENLKGRELPGESADTLAREAQRELRELFEKSDPICHQILDNLRARLHEAGYQPRSVLFELFQNADDAYSELDGEASAQSAPSAQFGVRCEGGTLTVVHSGRRINHTVTKNLGQDRDLSKMLALHHSDKGGESAVTGRFGLGFKSVFLVCDQPRVVSGLLAFTVHGGTFPVSVESTAAEPIRCQAEQLGQNKSSATVFALDLLPEKEEEVCTPFRNLAHLLPVFARRIRNVRINAVRFDWKGETQFTGPPGQVVEIGSWDTDTGPQEALVIRCGELGDVLFGWNKSCFVRMPDDLPSVWVTAPTTEEHRLGYLVNARELPIDIGRSQVAWKNPQSTEVLQKLAQMLGDTLIALASDAKWNATWPSFWSSFWNVVKTKGVRDELRNGLMWGPHGAACRLFTEKKALPTGLDVPSYSHPTKLSDVRGVVTGIMAQQTDVFRMVAGWESFQNDFPQGTLVAKAVGDLLPERDWLQINWVTAVQKEMREPFVGPKRAERLGHVLSPSRLNHLFDRDGEIAKVQKELKTAQFRNAAGEWKSPSQLVVAGGSDQVADEERLQAGFAPCGCLLAEDYTETAIAFFQACRGEIRTSVETLQGWISAVDTGDKNRKEAVLIYLNRGNSGQRIRAMWSENPDSRPSWINESDIRTLSQDAGLTSFEQSQLWTVFTPTNPWLPQPSHHCVSQSRVGGILDRIAEWWEQNQNGQLNAYYDSIYPNKELPAISADGSLDDPDVRKAWLKLLITGSLQTLGRVKPQQNRRFIGICEQRRWFEMLADPETGSGRWLADVQRYVDDPRNHANIQYFHWLRHFISIETLARHLDNYVNAFLDINQFSGQFTSSDLFTIRTSRQFQGTGLDAPPMLPFLGIGACFVLRELVISGIVERADVHPYCYAPVKRLRDRLARLGWQDHPADDPQTRSRSIYEFLAEHHSVDPTFGGDYDIPLLMYPAWDSIG